VGVGDPISRLMLALSSVKMWEVGRGKGEGGNGSRRTGIAVQVRNAIDGDIAALCGVESGAAKADLPFLQGEEVARLAKRVIRTVENCILMVLVRREASLGDMGVKIVLEDGC
jgi:hypothetical protein